MKFFEEYPEFNGYPIPPYLSRLQEAEETPNTSMNRALLHGALKNHRSYPPSLLNKEINSAEVKPESPDWTPYKSPYISEEEAGIRAAHQNTAVEHEMRQKTAYIPQFQALGNYSLGALAKGYTMPAGDGEHYICVTKAYSFANDSFDFKGFQWLGNWDIENGDFSALLPLDMRLFNHTFRNFAETTKHGRDFRIVSPLYEIPKKELEFNGKETINGDICWKVAK